MKFTGLILMCAASCLALLLPALGVVKFPVLDDQIAAAEGAPGSDPGLAPRSSPGSDQLATQFQELPGQLTGQLPKNPSVPNGNDSGATAGLLAAARASAGNETQVDSAGSQNPNRQRLGRLPFTEIPSQRLGLGVWLLLVPILFLGLGMWTFGSSPRSSK